MFTAKEEGVYDEVYRAEHDAAQGKPKELADLAGKVAAGAADMRGNRPLARYLQLRAYALARAGGVPFEKLVPIASRSLELMDGQTPAEWAQRAELAASLHEASLATGKRGDSTQAANAAATAYANMAEWQVTWNYLPEALASLTVAERMCRLSGDADIGARVAELRKTAERRQRLRDDYAKTVSGLGASPKDPKLNGRLARFLIAQFGDLQAATQPARSSDDALLLAFAKAMDAPQDERAAAVGSALAALADAGGEDDKPLFAHRAVEQLKLYLARSRADETLFLKSKLALSRMERLCQDAGALDQAGASAVFQRTQAKAVVYVCDASGSMLDKFDTLRTELTAAVRELTPDQSFNVVFFGTDRGFLAFNERNLVAATEQNRTKVHNFLQQTGPRGQTDVIAALRVAFGCNPKPQLIYLLTDGEFDDNEAVIKWIDENNKDKKVKINTILFVKRKDAEMNSYTSITKTLQTIASRNGGQYRLASDHE